MVAAPGASVELESEEYPRCHLSFERGACTLGGCLSRRQVGKSSRYSLRMGSEPCPCERDLASCATVNSVDMTWRGSTYYVHRSRPMTNDPTMPAKLCTIFLALSEVKLERCCLLTISSSLGCLHVPVTGVEGADCATGVEGRTGVDIVNWSVQVSEILLLSCNIVRPGFVYCNVNRGVNATYPANSVSRLGLPPLVSSCRLVEVS